MKIKYLILTLVSLLVLSACSLTGEKQVILDESTPGHLELVSLGKIKSCASVHNFLSEVTASFVKKVNEKKTCDYYLFLNSYTESSNGRDCPKAENGSKVVFLVNGKSYESCVSGNSLKHEMWPGVTGVGCFERDIKIGPLPLAVVDAFNRLECVKFKLYGLHHMIEGEISSRGAQIIHDFLHCENDAAPLPQRTQKAQRAQRAQRASKASPVKNEQLVSETETNKKGNALIPSITNFFSKAIDSQVIDSEGGPGSLFSSRRQSVQANKTEPAQPIETTSKNKVDTSREERILDKINFF